ncbi:MAG: hypothetical protein NVSMB63_18570 [Sediminibacterium sp.]
MKKVYVIGLVICSLSIITPAFSQKKGFHLGIKGGVNATKIDGVSFSNGFQYNYLLGGLIQIPIAKKISIQPEVLFSQSKTTASNNPGQPFDPNNPNNKNVTLDYLNIPILLNLGGAFKFQLGPQYSIKLNNNKTLLQNGGDAFKSGDFSVCGGFQWRLPVLGIHVGARYVIGLSDINSISSQDKWKSQSLQISTGFIF